MCRASLWKQKDVDELCPVGNAIPLNVMLDDINHLVSQILQRLTA